MNRIFLLALLTIFLFPSAHAIAQKAGNDAFQVTGLPIPRFVSLNSSKIYMRTGPGRKYPILWEYQRKGLPVEIVMEFDVWRKIRDSDGDQGWVHQSLLSGKRTAIVTNEDMVAVKRAPEKDARVMAYVEPGAVIALQSCESGYCNVQAGAYTGWVERKFIWGVYASEEFN